MSKKIVFMGTPEFSIDTLETLADSSEKVACVYTQPPKKSSRGQKINISPVQKVAENKKINFRTPENLDTDEEYDYFKKLSPCIVIVVAYGKIIPKQYLDIKDNIFINIHASLLPKWRGAAPIQRSIMNCDKETGISIMKIVEKLDAGPFMKQIKIKIDEQTNTKNLSKQLSKLGAENILNCINLIKKNEANFIEQEHSESTYAKKIKKSESKIIWQENAKNILAKINGLNPFPGAWFEYNGARYKIWKAGISNLQGKPGEILDEKITIACKDLSIKIIEIQKEGKNRMTLDNFLSGEKISKKIIIH
jgi:methionyl-tRNA formyltransferase|tara:strand:+ start:1198 stop:2118 length:921 start_codon:yes stop_codon:yes gene_type:complete